MTTFISILRGINVSGHKLIKMEALRKSYEHLGFKNVKTYVQSGNVIFAAKELPIKELENQISRQIKKDFGHEVPVIVLTTTKLKEIIDSNPFLHQPDKDPAFLHVTFLSSKPENPDLKPLEDKKLSVEEISLIGDTVYLYCPNGYGKTKLVNGFIESKLKVVATTRNWKTTNELLKIAQGPDHQ